MLYFLLLESTEAQGHGLAEWVQAAMDAHAVQLLAAAAVELEDLEARGDHPDVGEGDVSELTAPLHGDADAAAGGHDHVAEVLAAVEAFVRISPHAVHGVLTFGLGEDVLEGDLVMRTYKLALNNGTICYS